MTLFQSLINEILNEKRMMLSELFVYGDKSDQSYIVAFHKHIFLFKDTYDEKNKAISDVLKKLDEVWQSNIASQHNYFKSEQYKFDDARTVIEKLQSLVKDIFIGKILENEQTLYVYNFGDFDGQHSPYFRQILRQLKIDDVIEGGYIGDEGVKFITNSEIKSLPDIGYHGTSSKYLTSILKTGIQKDKPSNWKDVQHTKYIFFSTKTIKPLFHAQTISKFQNSIPIIIEFKIPNKNLITHDFDIEKYTGTDDIYTDIKSSIKKKAISNKPMSLTKNKGIYAYIGNIEPQYIKAVWCPKKDSKYFFEEDFIRILPKEAIEHLGLFY